MYEGTPREMVIQEAVFTRQGVDRILRHAFEVASKRAVEKGQKGRVTSATKSNGIIHTMPYWDERFAAMAEQFPNIETDQFHIDILSAHFVQHPDWFDVVVGSNLFGDILSDLGAAVVGGMGLAPAANLNPAGEYPSMFEPVHGAGFDITGKGVANPIATFFAISMMLEHLGENDIAQKLNKAIISSLTTRNVLTPDLGGNASTSQVTDEIMSLMD